MTRRAHIPRGFTLVELLVALALLALMSATLLGSLALIGTPLFAGFYSKDSIIEAVHASHLPGAGFASFAVTLGVFVTAFYSFRMYFLVFHGEERFRNKPFPPEDDHDAEHADPAHVDPAHAETPSATVM